MKILVTGGLGFIGSAVVRALIESEQHDVLNVDSRTYAATDGSVAAVASSTRYAHSVTDITNFAAVQRVVDDFGPDAIMHLAAESHVDRSIDGPSSFINTNVLGTFHLLEAARSLNNEPRFLHVSTDEVFGSLSMDDAPFNELTPYAPSSPYSASKAASDHLVRAWHETYGMDVVLTNCSNNYGPFQFPEKLIPLMTLKALAGQSLPVYGDGANVRDWLHVEDHVRALIMVLKGGESGQTYAIGGNTERSNLEVVHELCDIVDDLTGGSGSSLDLVQFVGDRPGHDLRYAIDARKLRDELGWKPEVAFGDGLSQTVRWYVDNEDWWSPLVSDASLRRGIVSSS